MGRRTTLTIKGKAKDLGLLRKVHEGTQQNSDPNSQRYQQLMRIEQRDPHNGSVSPKKVPISPSDASATLRTIAFKLGADLIGCTKLLPAQVLEGQATAGPWAVSLALEMEYDQISTSPETPSAVEVARTYYELGAITIKLAEAIRSLGYKAMAHHPRGFEGKVGAILHKPVAVAAGLGEIGRHTMVITPEFGPRVRLSTISTDLKLEPTGPLDIGIANYCRACSKCLLKCPGGAIPKERSQVPSFDGRTLTAKKAWRIDAERCLPQFIETDGCSVCVKECTFNKRPGDAIPFIERTLKVRYTDRSRPR